MRKPALALVLLTGLGVPGGAQREPEEIAAISAPTRPAARRKPGHYQRLLLECGAVLKPGERWLLGLPARPFAAAGAFPDRLVWLDAAGRSEEFPARLPARSAGLYEGEVTAEGVRVGAEQSLDQTHLGEGLEALRARIGEGAFRIAWLDSEQANLLPRLAPARASAEQKFNHYYRYLVARGGSLGNGKTAVLGLRGLAPDGRRHDSADNQGGYDDTYVVLRRDRQGGAHVREFVGSTHAGRAVDEDAPPQGVAQVRPGRYPARPDGYHHGMPAWFVRDQQGRNRIPAWRDGDADGRISEEERAGAAHATYILFHNGLYLDRCSSIGCLTMAPPIYQRFVHTVGKSTPFEFTLVDANQPLDVSTVRYRLGQSRRGSPLWMYELGNGPRTALYFASIHGDEPVGTDLLQRLRAHWEEHPEEIQGWRVRLIPCLNPDSLGKRRGNSKGVDLNRNFPEAWKRSIIHNAEYSGSAPLSEPESKSLHAAVLGRDSGPAGRPQRILSIHQHHGVAAGRGLLDGDGPAEGLVATMLEAGEERFEAHKIADSQGRLRIPGSFGTWVASPALRIPTVTYELSHADRSRERNWELNYPLLRAFLQAP